MKDVWELTDARGWRRMAVSTQQRVEAAEARVAELEATLLDVSRFSNANVDTLQKSRLTHATVCDQRDALAKALKEIAESNSANYWAITVARAALASLKDGGSKPIPESFAQIQHPVSRDWMKVSLLTGRIVGQANERYPDIPLLGKNGVTPPSDSRPSFCSEENMHQMREEMQDGGASPPEADSLWKAANAALDESIRRGDELDARDARIAELKAALRPFATIADLFNQRIFADLATQWPIERVPIGIAPGVRSADHELTYGDFLNAAAALSGARTKGEE